MKKPCKECPFRHDTLKGWLGEQKATEVAQCALSDTNFYCHKSLVGGNIGHSSQVCAGSVLLHQKEGRPNRYYRCIEHAYSGAKLVFDSAKAFIRHHSR